MKRGGRGPENNNNNARRSAPGGIPTGEGLGAAAAGGAPAAAPAPAPAAPASFAVVRRKTPGPRLGEGGGGGGGPSTALVVAENDPLRDLKRFSRNYNAVMHLLSGSLDATATVLRSLDGLAGTVAESAKNRLVELLKATGSGVMGVAGMAARAAPTVGAAVGSAGAAVGAALEKFSKFVSRKETPMTAFRLYMTLDPMRHGLAYNAEQPDELRRFLDVRVLAMDKASLKMEDLATRQFALAVNQYLQQPSPIFADNVIKAFIYWRSVVNYHRVQKEVTLGSTAGIMVIPKNSPHSISGVPLIRPPSVISWGGKRIAEFDIQDANVVLAILKSGTPELTAYMCQALQIRGADELTPEHIMKPSKWTPRLGAGAGAGAAAAANSDGVKELMQELTDISKETQKIGQLDAAASHGKLELLEREGLFRGVSGGNGVGSQGGLGGLENNRGLGSFPTPAGTQEEGEEQGLMELLAEKPATEVEGGAANAGGGGASAAGGGANAAGGAPRRRRAQAGGRRSKRKHTAKKRRTQKKPTRR
jgi:hypothetical protein